MKSKINIKDSLMRKGFKTKLIIILLGFCMLYVPNLDALNQKNKKKPPLTKKTTSAKLKSKPFYKVIQVPQLQAEGVLFQQMTISVPQKLEATGVAPIAAYKQQKLKNLNAPVRKLIVIQVPQLQAEGVKFQPITINVPQLEATAPSRQRKKK